MTFLELLQSGEELNCDLIIGGVDMPSSLVWDEDCYITEYGIEKYRPIMDAEVTRISPMLLEIHCDDWKLGEEFALAVGGHICITEYEKIFGEENEHYFMCCLHEGPRTLDWCEENCQKYYRCDTVAMAIDDLKRKEGEL